MMWWVIYVAAIHPKTQKTNDIQLLKQFVYWTWQVENQISTGAVWELCVGNGDNTGCWMQEHFHVSHGAVRSRYQGWGGNWRHQFQRVKATSTGGSASSLLPFGSGSFATGSTLVPDAGVVNCHRHHCWMRHVCNQSGNQIRPLLVKDPINRSFWFFHPWNLSRLAQQLVGWSVGITQSWSGLDIDFDK